MGGGSSKKTKQSGTGQSIRSSDVATAAGDNNNETAQKKEDTPELNIPNDHMAEDDATQEVR